MSSGTTDAATAAWVRASYSSSSSSRRPRPDVYDAMPAAGISNHDPTRPHVDLPLIPPFTLTPSSTHRPAPTDEQQRRSVEPLLGWREGEGWTCTDWHRLAIYHDDRPTAQRNRPTTEPANWPTAMHCTLHSAGVPEHYSNLGSFARSHYMPWQARTELH